MKQNYLITWNFLNVSAAKSLEPLTAAIHRHFRRRGPGCPLLSEQQVI
jgi:hypothetical protein